MYILFYWYLGEALAATELTENPLNKKKINKEEDITYRPTAEAPDCYHNNKTC